MSARKLARRALVLLTLAGAMSAPAWARDSPPRQDPSSQQELAAPIEYDRYGHALILDADGWVYVDRRGRTVLRPFIYDNGPDDFEEGLARFVRKGKMGFHDEALKIVIPARYDFAFPFRNGVAKVGMDCRFRPQGEHKAVDCESWELVDLKGRKVRAK